MSKERRAKDGESLVVALLGGKSVGRIGDEGAAAIAAAPSAAKLHTLSLGFAGLGPAGARALAQSTLLTSVTTLNLEGNDIGDDGAQALAGSKALAGLRVLKLGDSGFGARGHAARNGITSRGAEAIANSKALAGLTELGLPLYEIDAGLATALTKSPLARFLYLGPGAVEGSRASPDGKLSAHVSADVEVWPDGPRAGTLELSLGARVPDCGPSMVWSSDSRLLAVPQWIRGKQGYAEKCRVLVVRPDGKSAVLRGEHPALALWAFDGGTLSAFDAMTSPRMDLALDVNAIA